MKRLIIVLALIGSACASAPPLASPQAQVAFKKHEVQKDLDLLRDIAIDAQAQALISEADTRTIVTWHKAAITVMHDTVNWQTGIRSSLDALQHTLSPASQSLLKPYIALALAVLKGLS